MNNKQKSEIKMALEKKIKDIREITFEKTKRHWKVHFVVGTTSRFLITPDSPSDHRNLQEVVLNAKKALRNKRPN